MVDIPYLAGLYWGYSTCDLSMLTQQTVEQAKLALHIGYTMKLKDLLDLEPRGSLYKYLCMKRKCVVVNLISFKGS